MTVERPSADAHNLRPRILVFGVGGAGGNAVNNMIDAQLQGVEFVAANTDAQQLALSKADRRIQLGVEATQGLGAGAQPMIGATAAEESLDEIVSHLDGAHMAFITAGMGGGTGTGAAPIVARAARERGLLTVGVVTKPFGFEGRHRMRMAEAGIAELRKHTDTLIVVPNQNLFRIATARTTFAEAFKMADEVLHSGVRSVTDLIVLPGLINLDFADVLSVMAGMGDAMMGTGEAEGEGRAVAAAERALENPLLDTSALVGAKSVLVNVTGGTDLTLLELDEAANAVAEQVDPDANIIFGAAFHPSLEGRIRVSVIATGMAQPPARAPAPPPPIERTPEPEPVQLAPEPLVEFDLEPEFDAAPPPRPAPQPAPPQPQPPQPEPAPAFLRTPPEPPKQKGGWLSRFR